MYLHSSVDLLIISENYFGRVGCHLGILPSKQLQIFVIITQTICKVKYHALIVFLAKMSSGTFLRILYKETVKLFVFETVLPLSCHFIEYGFRGLCAAVSVPCTEAEV